MGIASNRRLLPLACVLCSSALAVHCGARTPLQELASRGEADAGDAESSIADAQSEAVADSAPEAMPDAVHDINAPDGVAAACALLRVGDPVEILAVEGQDLHTPSVVVLEPGSEAVAQTARVAIQSVGGSIRLIDLNVYQPGPAGTLVSPGAPMVLGGGMTYAQMVRAPGDLQQLALVWGADGPGNEFRTVDIPSWTPGPLVSVSKIGWTPNGLASGKGVHNTQSGQYEGLGYGMTWQGGTSEAPHMAVLSETGEVLVGPLSPAVGVPNDLIETAIAWSGSTYLMATRFRDCSPGDALCRERSVVITRLRVKPGSNSIEFAASFEVGTPGWSPGHPTLDGVHLVFDEGPGGGESRVVHVEELSEDGVLVGSDHVVSYSARPLARQFIGSTPSGNKLVGWAEDGDTGIPDDELGRSRLVLQVLAPELGPQGALVELPITRFGSMGTPPVVSLEYPRGVLLVWSAQSRKSVRRALFAQFLPCVG